MGKHEKERDGFKSRTGFILACIGSAVGMGNIWRFPYMVSDWGGMTFLIPYILFVILIAFYRSDRRDGTRTRRQRWTNQSLRCLYRNANRQ